eukprot:752687-Hanusia_phi.AAC.2
MSEVDLPSYHVLYSSSASPLHLIAPGSKLTCPDSSSSVIGCYPLPGLACSAHQELVASLAAMRWAARQGERGMEVIHEEAEQPIRRPCTCRGGETGTGCCSGQNNNQMTCGNILLCSQNFTLSFKTISQEVHKTPVIVSFDSLLDKIVLPPVLLRIPVN